MTTHPFVAYRLLRDDLPGALSEEVTRAMAHGWQPYGAPGYAGSTGWFQAMVRYEERTARRVPEDSHEPAAAAVGALA